MPGFWVTLYKQTSTEYTNDDVAGYLYCCVNCNNVIRLSHKTEREICPKCKEPIVETN